MTLRSNQPLTDMSTSNVCRG